MINCPNCGAENPDGNIYCGKCNSFLSEYDAVNSAALMTPESDGDYYSYDWQIGGLDVSINMTKRAINSYVFIIYPAICILLASAFYVMDSLVLAIIFLILPIIGVLYYILTRKSRYERE